MAFADRAYSRREPSYGSRFAAMREWSLTAWLIAVLGVVFLLDAVLTPPAELFPLRVMDSRSSEEVMKAIQSGEIVTQLMGPIARHAHFSAATAIDRRQWWRALTFPVVHTDVWPLFLNLVCLYGFGRAMEEALGARRIVALYALGVFAAPATYLLLRTFNGPILGPWAPLSGATAGVLGLLAAAAWTGPNDEVNIWTTGVSLPRRTLALIACVGVALIAVKRDPTSADTAHLGGALVGLLAAPLLRRRWRT